LQFVRVPSETIRFPQGGPYNERLGYVQLPSFVESLTARHFIVERQAEWSPMLDRFVNQSGYAIYREKSRAGLKLLDRDQTPIYQANLPGKSIQRFQIYPAGRHRELAVLPLTISQMLPPAASLKKGEDSAD
jgi:hypothetical protein